MDKNLILFCNALSISNKAAINIIEYFSDYKDLINNIDQVKEIKGLDKRICERILKNKAFDLKDYLEKVKSMGIKMTFIEEEDYPTNLNYIEDPPLMLYYLGTLQKDDMYGISMVGSRKCTSYGAWACKEIARDLSRNGIPIISGLAYGIDKIAHETSLQNNNRTIGVIGNGIDVIYPKTHKELYERVSRNGAVVSEYPLGTTPKNYNFPYRNRIISGIGQGVVVVEAMRKSGTLITANYALDQGKDVFAIPGNINSFYSLGTNALIREGAKIVTEVDDILEDIHCPNEIENKEIIIQLEDPTENDIINILLKNPCTSDIISDQLGIAVEDINATLTKLEMKGYVSEEMGGIFYPIVRKE